ncbi:MAG: ABC transporter permease [Dehalococcoidia bacterium]
MIKQFLKLAVTEFKLTLREPLAVFFGFAFPVLFLFLTMEIFIPADAPKEIVVNYIVPPLMVLVIASTAIFGVPMTIVGYREIKFFKRLRATPLNPLVLLGSLGIANFIVTILGILLLVLGGKLFYQARFDGNLLIFSSGFLLGFLSLISMGFIIVSVGRTVRRTIVTSNIIFLPTMFFSGVFVPLDMLPDWTANYISPFMPMTYAVKLLQGLWLGEPLVDFAKEMIFLLGFLVLGLAISAKTFRWE